MYNHMVISLAVTTMPILAFIFVIILLLHKLYVKIRSQFNMTVNCWFCNQNTRVPYLESNSWTCPQCEQYNGFTKDGDYNCEIFQQLDCSSSASVVRHEYSSEHDTSGSALGVPKNGFCHECNEAQRLKVEKLAQFGPKKESHFEAELKVYKAHLEEQYRLCSTCDRHLRKVLHEKKKMVLGSKFLDFIIKGAGTLEQPHLNQIRHVQRNHWKRRLSYHMTLLTLLNVLCLCYMLPALTRDHITTILGEQVGEQIFLVLSHGLALCRVVSAYLASIAANPLLEKFVLFVRTIFMMFLYSLGLKLPQIERLYFTSIYLRTYPFTLLGLTFGYKLVDDFKLTRFTFLLALWSIFAGGLVKDHLYLSPTSLMFFASALTLIFLVTNDIEISPKLQDSSINSFHKIYSEDYFSDEDTISLLSQQLNSSSSSTIRYASPSGQQSPPNKTRLFKSPVTSSTFSLQNIPNSQFSPSPRYKSCYFDGQSNSIRSQYAGSSVGDFNNTVALKATRTSPAPLYRSNLELNNHERPRSTVFGCSGNYNSNANTNTSLVNSSISGEIKAHSLHTQSSDIFGQYRPSTSRNNRNSLHSPFLLSNNTLYQQQRPVSTNLLTPSRFNVMYQPSNVNAASWVSTDCFNQTNNDSINSRSAIDIINDNLSRASSQSSGFESQNDRLNVSRENSFSAETNDSLQRTKPLDTTGVFQTIDTNKGSTFSPRLSMLSNPPVVAPLTVNCATSSPLVNNNSSETWGVPTKRKNICGRDTFNFRKINDELPLSTYKYKRGDLLKKWKDSQNIF